MKSTDFLIKSGLSKDLRSKDAVCKAFKSIRINRINYVCWTEPRQIPDVSFKVVHTEDSLAIKYFVSETSHRAVYSEINDPVFKDSCVEFFVAIDDSGNYYNFECNSLGVVMASYGKDRNGRIKLDKNILKNIVIWIDWIEYSPVDGIFKWELTMMLTPSVFYFNELINFCSKKFLVNLYKCGDDLPEPHYLSWNPITSSKMDFHQSEFFGTLVLS